MRQQFTARNNLPGELQSLAELKKPAELKSLTALASAESTSNDEPGYWNDFDAVRKSAPIVPAFSHTEHAKPTARGIQTATVVGPSGEEVFTDELGRIKIQCHWARVQDHEVGQHGAGANKDDFSSCWVRVSYPSAGANWGHQFIPRIGQEVVVTFIENDIDRPVVTAVVYNGQHTPPAFSGAGTLPANKTLSGIKSQEHKGAGYNEILFDDTRNEIRTKLSSEHGKTQLNQGYLIHPRQEGKGDPRGEGFELRTDKAGVLRAAQGLLIATEPQANASGNQLDRAAANAILDNATKLADQLGDTAKAAKANQPETGKNNQTVNADFQSGSSKPQGHLHHLKDATQTLERKSNTDKEGKSGNGSQAGQQPVLILSGQQGIAITTPQSAAITTGSNLDQIALGDHHQTTGRRWISNATESISLFVSGKAKEAIKLFAAKGNIQVQAQSADIEIDGDQSLTITSCKETITASAQKEITIACGGAVIKLSGGNIEVSAPGTISLKGAQQSATGPASMKISPPVLPILNMPKKDSFVLRWNVAQALGLDPTTSNVIEQLPYEMRDSSGKLLATGQLDSKGLTGPVVTEKAQKVNLYIGDGSWLLHNDVEHTAPSE
jgi:type VI secretion system secreted protein VgrG